MTSSIDFHPKRRQDPEHLGIIPDGCRRWARQQGLSLPDGYDRAMENLAHIVAYSFEEDIRTISLYMASAQNFRRTPEDVTAFSRAEAKACDLLLAPLAQRMAVEVRITGTLELAPDYLREAAERLVKNSPKGTRRRMYLCVAYDPFEEIERGVRARQKGVSLVDALEVQEPIDLIIRSGGANCLSNFLPLQAGYARLYFLEKLFTDLTVEDVRSVLERFRAISASRLYGE